MIEKALSRWGPPDAIDIIACSDGEQILGIGDQGTGAVSLNVDAQHGHRRCTMLHPSDLDPTLTVIPDPH